MAWRILRWLGLAAVPLSAATEERLNVLFPGSERARAKKVLLSLPSYATHPPECERFQFALLRHSNGSIDELEEWAFELRSDFRTVLCESGFAELEAHKSWFPKGPGLDGPPPLLERARWIFEWRRMAKEYKRKRDEGQ